MSKVDLSLTWVVGPDAIVCKSGDGRFAYMSFDHPQLRSAITARISSTVEPTTTKGHKEPSHDVLVMRLRERVMKQQELLVEYFAEIVRLKRQVEQNGSTQ